MTADSNHTIHNPIVKRVGPFYLNAAPGIGIACINGYGIGWTDHRRHRLSLDERYPDMATRRYHHIGNWCFCKVKP